MVTAVGDNYDWVGIFKTPNTTSGSNRWWRLQDNPDENYPVAPSGEAFNVLTLPSEHTPNGGELPVGTWYVTYVEKDTKSGSTNILACIEITVVDN